MPLELRLRSPLTTTLEVAIAPDKISQMSRGQIEKLPALCGRDQQSLAEIFEIKGDAQDRCIRLEGDFRLLDRLGSGMSAGEIYVTGDVGNHAGEQMTGGSLHVTGSTGDWLGAEMRGGSIRVSGDTGRWLGAALPGSPRGISGGMILVHGSAGHDVGWRMRRGLIAIGADAGNFVGQDLLAGTILVFGQPGDHPGAGMRRGTIALLAVPPSGLLPTFKLGNRFRPQFMDLLAKDLMRRQFAPAAELLARTFSLYHGDALALGRGEILLAA